MRLTGVMACFISPGSFPAPLLKHCAVTPARHGQYQQQRWIRTTSSKFVQRGDLNWLTLPGRVWPEWGWTTVQARVTIALRNGGQRRFIDTPIMLTASSTRRGTTPDSRQRRYLIEQGNPSLSSLVAHCATIWENRNFLPYWIITGWRWCDGKRHADASKIVHRSSRRTT